MSDVNTPSLQSLGDEENFSHFFFQDREENINFRNWEQLTSSEKEKEVHEYLNIEIGANVMTNLIGESNILISRESITSKAEFLLDINKGLVVLDKQLNTALEIF